MYWKYHFHHCSYTRILALEKKFDEPYGVVININQDGDLLPNQKNKTESRTPSPPAEHSVTDDSQQTQPVLDEDPQQIVNFYCCTDTP